VLDYFPKYFSNKAIILYLITLVLVSVLYFSYIMSFIWWVLGISAVVGFFYFSNKLTQKWSSIYPASFSKKVFTTALIIRVVWVLFSYFLYVVMTGQPFEFSVGDAKMYQRIGEALAETGFGNYENVFWGMPVSDRGYGTYLGVLYMVVGNSILIARLVKAVLGAWMCVLIYKLASRNFGDAVGRMAAIFCMLMPNLIYYSGLHLKEAEMVFLVVLFIERADSLIRVHKYTFMTVLPTLIIGGSLFFFRTVLGVTAFFALFTAMVFSSRRVMSMSKKIVIAGWLVVALAYFAGSAIINEVEELWEDRVENQETSLEFRASREGGNTFAKYASKSIFAPMIFVIPFPTMVDISHQQNQQLLHGGYFVKNIMAFFVIFALIYIVKNKKWRDYLLIVTFTIGYLMVVALSAFAQSERFHLPALPFFLVIAAYGISIISNREKKVFNMYLVLLFVIFVAWNWFKLAGRGMT
jgi:hypothetical protein